jgi:ribose transport system substrate-binding protein
MPRSDTRHRRSAIVIGLVIAAAASACSRSASTSLSAPAAPSSQLSVGAGTNGILSAVHTTAGPNGEPAANADILTLTPAEVGKLRAGHYSVAMNWAATSPFIVAVQSGVTAELSQLGIGVSSTSQANYDVATQASQVATVLSAKPQVLISIPIDPTTASAIYNQAAKVGTKLVFMSNVPASYTAGDQYVGVVSDNLFDMGKSAADALAESIGGKGDIGVIYYAEKFYVTNERDSAFETVIHDSYPDIHIAAQAGFTDPTKVQDIAQEMLAAHPDLAGIYVSWSAPAEGVLAALRATGNRTTKLVTLDLDDTVLVSMAQGDQVAAIVADYAYDLGIALAKEAGYAILGKAAPAFSEVGSITVTKSNIVQAYEESLHTSPSALVLEALK